MHRSKLVFTLLETLAVALVASHSHAQMLTTIASFNSTTGAQPYGDLTLVGSTFYGMTATNYTNLAGPYGQGTVFSLPLAGGTPTTLASFNGTNGGLPYGNLTPSADGSTLYGMATYGGPTNNGTIFSLPVTGGTPTVLTSFNNTDGGNPYGSLTLVGTNLYGMTSVGGAHGDGTVFSVPVTGGTPDILTSFNGTNGGDPTGNLTLSANGSTFYGMSNGVNNDGTVFSIPVTGGAPTVLATFTNGEEPGGSLTLSGSTLYGMTYGGGTYGDGTIFSIPVTGGTPTTLLSFNGTDGKEPSGSLTLIGSTLYGMTPYGGASAPQYDGDGNIFSIQTNGGDFQNLVIFNGANGWNPHGDLTSVGSTLYGMTTIGNNGYGTVFALVLPEPSSAVLLGFGAIGLAAMAIRRRMRKRAA